MRLDRDRLINIVKTARQGELTFREVSKDELYQVLQLLMREPLVGLADTGTPETIHDEYKRIVRVFNYPQGTTRHQLIENLVNKVTYDTLIIIIQLLQNGILVNAEANQILTVEDKELLKVSESLRDLNGRLEAGEDTENAEILVNHRLVRRLLVLVSQMSNNITSMLHMISLPNDTKMQ